MFQSATRSLEVARSAIEGAPTLDSLVPGSVEHHAYVNALRACAAALRFTGHLEEAEAETQHFLQLARDSGYLDLRQNGHQQLSLIAERRGDAETALRYARRMLEDAERLDTPRVRVGAYHTLSRAHALAENWSAAIEAGEEAMKLSRAHRTGMGLGVGFLPVLVDAHRAQGNFDRAFEVLADALDGSGLPKGRILLAQARLLADSQGAEAAAEIERVLDAAEADFERIDWHEHRPDVLVERAALARLRGNEEERRRYLQRAHELYVERGATGRAERVARELGPGDDA